MIANRTGICPNTGRCDNADNKRQFVVPTDRPFECPSCHMKLKDASGGSGILPSAVKAMVSLLVLVGLLVLMVAGYRSCKPGVNNNDNSPPAPSPVPSPTTTPSLSSNCKGLPMHKNVWGEIANRGYLIMGVQASAPPMNDSEETEAWEKEHGEEAEEERRQKELSWKRTGFDYELAQMIASRMGLLSHTGNVKAREVPEFRDLFCLLNRQEKDGRFSVDMIMSGIVRDPIYDDTISWSKPYAKFGGYSLVTKKSSYIETPDDCKNKKIGIVRGDNIVKAYVVSQMRDSEIVELSDKRDEWLSDALNLDQVAAVVYDYPFAVEELKWINEQAREQGVLGNLLEIRIASLPNFELTYSIGVPKGEDDLLVHLNEAIDHVTSDDNPRYAALIKKYLQSKDITPVQITAQQEVYVVQQGDSLSSIALKKLGDARRFKELGTLNNIPNIHLIVPGQKLIWHK